MPNAAHLSVSKPSGRSAGSQAPATPIERSLPNNPARELVSRLKDVNVHASPATALPKQFGRGAMFWRSDSMHLAPKFRRIHLPDAKDSASVSALSTQYGEKAVTAYQRARQFAEPFAQLDKGLAQLDHHFNPHKVTEIRAQLTNALKENPQFAEAWILLSRTLKRGEDTMALDEKVVPAKFVQSLASAMADPHNPNLIMQLNSALPAPSELPDFLNNQASSDEHALPLSKARLALYVLRHLDPGHAGALSALVESGESITLGQLMPVDEDQGQTQISQEELGAMAMIDYHWQTGFLALRHARTASADGELFTPGGGATLTADQLETLIKLETEESDPNAGPSFDRESGQSLLDRDQARAHLLDELADTLAGPDSWLYVPNYLLMNQKQLRALANVFRAQYGAFDKLRQAISEPTPLPIQSLVQAQAPAAASNDPDLDQLSDEASHGGLSEAPSAAESASESASESEVDGGAAPEATGPAPVPIYRNTAITPDWISAHQELVEGRSDPALFRQLAAQAKASPLGFVSVMGQAFRARDLELRADLLENNQKPASEQSAAPVFRLYLDQAKEIANNTVRNPALIKQQPFVLKLSNQRGHPLSDLLSQLPITWGRNSLERDLVSALKTFMRDFDESRSAPFRALSAQARQTDGDFKRALAVVDLMAQMPERFQALRSDYDTRREEAEKLSQEKGVPLPEPVSAARFPDTPVFTAPDRCTCCLESEETAEDPLLTIPFDPGGHRSCLAEKMIVTGRPDLKGAWDEAPALSFIEWTDQANQAIKGYSDFIRAHQPPPAPAAPPVPPRAPIVREPSPPLGLDAIDRWVEEQLGRRQTGDSASDDLSQSDDDDQALSSGEALNDLDVDHGDAASSDEHPGASAALLFPDLEAQDDRLAESRGSMPHPHQAQGADNAARDADSPADEMDLDSVGLESLSDHWGWSDDERSVN